MIISNYEFPSKASFDPPWLSIAVKKYRAVENLMLVGNRFNINILKEGSDKVWHPTASSALRSERDQVDFGSKHQEQTRCCKL